MKNAKYEPGLWQLRRISDYAILVLDKNGKCVCEVRGAPKEVEKNALLVLHAPLLLTAAATARSVILTAKRNTDLDRAAGILKEAIDTALGEERCGLP